MASREAPRVLQLGKFVVVIVVVVGIFVIVATTTVVVVAAAAVAAAEAAIEREGHRVGAAGQGDAQR